ncbi:hypothetical protein [Candidatus Venteria ishoeyi]|uniref:DUF4412 domain-containing protein n=2 Tax=Candidatus Venteria ishoeyi TaxID=1899563 RepID=A0A1H6F612_9GAMM|nr:hypothetical protein [Candidatus Venteria ishoeyi]SEH04506.1 Uncharacterised protein [Candidatus Venteria ishoeyi]
MFYKKNYRAILINTLLIGSVASAANAATLIEQQSTRPNPMTKEVKTFKQTMLVEGLKGRMNGALPNGQYVLMDVGAGKTFMVNPKEKMVIDMSTPPQMPKMPKQLKQAPADKPAAKSELIKVGAGPEIAGYPTTHYQVKADGKLCADQYVSEPALKVKHLKHFMESMGKMNAERKKAVGAMPFMKMNPCFIVAEEVAGDLLAKGIVLRTQSPDGNRDFEVLKIQTDVSVPANDFIIPTGFEIATPQQMMQRAMQRMNQQMQKNMPPAK